MLASRPFHKWTSLGVTTIKTSPELRELAEGSTSRVCICLDPTIQGNTSLLFTVCQVCGFEAVYYREGFSWDRVSSASVLWMTFSNTSFWWEESKKLYSRNSKPQTAVGVVTGEGRAQHTEVEKVGNVEQQCFPQNQKCTAKGYPWLN